MVFQDPFIEANAIALGVPRISPPLAEVIARVDRGRPSGAIRRIKKRRYECYLAVIIRSKLLLDLRDYKAARELSIEARGLDPSVLECFFLDPKILDFLPDYR